MPDADLHQCRYPYAIPPLHCPDGASAKKLNVWDVQEFFRTELLLRSQAVQTIYRTGATGPESNVVLGLIYGFTWDVLQGSHHRYLTPSAGPIRTIPGLSIMSFQEFAATLETLHTFFSRLSSELKTQLLEQMHARFLGLMIDPTIPPETVLRAIRPTVEERHKARSTSRQKKPYPFNVPTWLEYLHCYDLRSVDGLSYGQIARRVYQQKGETTRDRAEKAVRRTQRFIRLAESLNWPPPKQLAPTS